MVTVADTAFVVAQIRAEERALPAPARLFDDPFATHFAAGGAHAAEATARYLALPFLREGIRLRTRFIDDFVREGLAAGARQVVLLGAGFDTRALRMPEIAAHGSSAFEVDFAEQLTRKGELLSAAGVMWPKDIACVACDFTHPDFDVALQADLETRGFRTGAGALFVWEGVISYLGKDAVARSLAFMARVGGPGTRLVLDFAEELFAPDGARDVVRRAGFTSFDDVGCDDLWRRYLGGEPHANASMIRLGRASV